MLSDPLHQELARTPAGVRHPTTAGRQREDYRQYYNLETYLFDVVRLRFLERGCLSAFDFFSIIVWKANRAKSKIAARLLRRGYQDLEEAVSALTGGLAAQPSPKDRLSHLLVKWGFYLPMASAILTVLYPDEFTVYDVRVCDALGDFHDLAEITRFERLWPRYEQFIEAVVAKAPAGLTLRDKDRYLWGRAFWDQLRQDVDTGFGAARSTVTEQ